MFHVQPITGQPYREPGAAVSHVIVGSPLVNERPAFYPHKTAFTPSPANRHMQKCFTATLANFRVYLLRKIPPQKIEADCNIPKLSDLITRPCRFFLFSLTHHRVTLEMPPIEIVEHIIFTSATLKHCKIVI